MPAVEIYWCRWAPKQLKKKKRKRKKRKGKACKEVSLGYYADIDSAQDDGWDVFMYQGQNKADRVGIKLPANFGGGLVSADAPANGPIQITFKTCCAPFTVDFGKSQCGCGSDPKVERALLAGLVYASATPCITCGSVRVCGDSPACH